MCIGDPTDRASREKTFSKTLSSKKIKNALLKKRSPKRSPQKTFSKTLSSKKTPKKLLREHSAIIPQSLMDTDPHAPTPSSSFSTNIKMSKLCPKEPQERPPQTTLTQSIPSRICDVVGKSMRLVVAVNEPIRVRKVVRDFNDGVLEIGCNLPHIRGRVRLVHPPTLRTVPDARGLALFLGGCREVFWGVRTHLP